MNPIAKLAVFAVLLVGVFGGGIALGAAVGPFAEAPPASHIEHAP